MRIDSIATHALRTPAAPACVDLESGRCWTYREFDSAINRAANWLVAELGPASGSRVATVARNCADMLILYFACIRAGAIFAPCNWRLSRAEIDVILDDATPKLLFSDTDFSLDGRAEKNYPLSELIRLSADFPALEPAGARRAAQQTSLLLYTSGTSGRPKGVMISEVNAIWSQIAFNSGNNVGSNSVFLCDMPLFHTAGLLANTRPPLLAGGTVLISRGFDEEKTLARLSDPDLAISHFFSVPQMASRLWNHPDFDPEKLRHLQVYATGGAPNSVIQIERFINAGIPMSNGYGMTEGGSISGTPVEDRQRVIEKGESSGILYFSTQARIVDLRGEETEPGEVGELWLRGPGVTAGYWNQPDKTREAFNGDWFMTGDLARIDEDGFLFIVDRKKDMFISGGENIYPAEIEASLEGFPGIDDAAVVGMPDPRWGEVGYLVVVANSAQALDERALMAYLKQRLASYKVPKQLVITDALPRTSTGKLQKAQLKRKLSTR